MNIINVENITKVYTERELFSKASFYVQEREKIGIVGINGTGKSTLLKIAAGLEEPDEGSVIRANHVVINFLPQNPEFESGKTVLDNVMVKIVNTDMDEAHRWSLESEAKSLMLKLGITDFDQLCGELSGGQKKRLALVAAVLKPCDVLILDEPTNDLDIQTLAILEDYLDRFDGIIIVVSHDRYFLDRTVNRIFSFEGDGVLRQFEGGYSDYLVKKELEKLPEEGLKASGKSIASEESKAESMKTWKQREKKVKFTFKEQKEFETIDDDIAKLEDKLESLDRQMAANATNSVKLKELIEEKEKAETQLEEKMDRWVYLNDIYEQMQK